MENREIKFRGLDAKGIWHYGDLVQGSMHGCAIRIEIDIPPSMSDPGGDTRVEYYTVRPETIGQYTGLKGKNGVEIYEGDIVKACGSMNFSNNVQKDEIREIYFMASGFTGIKPGNEFDKKNPSSACNWKNYTLWNVQRDIEVIGNVYQNPELINL